MTITDWKPLSRKAAREKAEGWRSKTSGDFEQMVQEWPETLPIQLNEQYKDLRKDLVTAMEDARAEADEQSSRYHCIDLAFGLDLYRLLDERGFNVRLASYDPVWIYLGMEVVPDLVIERFREHKKGAVLIPDERLFAKTRRIYLKQVWWYIYLSLQFDEQDNPDFGKTRRILEKNSTDSILQLVDRAGNGYRVDVTREIMKRYGENRDKYDGVALRRILVLNVARTPLVEPALCENGVRGYVEDLFSYYDEKRTS